jgi:hypothetical protein
MRERLARSQKSSRGIHLGIPRWQTAYDESSGVHDVHDFFALDIVDAGGMGRSRRGCCRLV